MQLTASENQRGLGAPETATVLVGFAMRTGRFKTTGAEPLGTGVIDGIGTCGRGVCRVDSILRLADDVFSADPMDFRIAAAPVGEGGDGGSFLGGGVCGVTIARLRCVVLCGTWVERLNRRFAWARFRRGRVGCSCAVGCVGRFRHRDLLHPRSRLGARRGVAVRGVRERRRHRRCGGRLPCGGLGVGILRARVRGLFAGLLIGRGRRRHRLHVRSWGLL